MSTTGKVASLLSSTAVAALAAFGFASSAYAHGTVILEGSDAIGYHCGFAQADACAYSDQTWSAIGGADPRPIAVVGDTTSGNPVTSGTHAIVDMHDLSTAGSLYNYAAIYFIGGHGCCNSDPGDMAGREADVLNYYHSGGTLEIGNYDGNSGWDFLTGGSGNSAHVGGIGGALPAPGCDDGETVTLAGTNNGFTQPGPIGCWTHQGYDQGYFAGLGFTKSFFDSPPAYAADNPGLGPFSSLLSNGRTITGGGVPEPATWGMMLLGMAGLGTMLRYRRRSVTA
jgi:hypothetical protein